MTDFREFCEEIKPSTFVFDTDNQPNGVDNDIKVATRYSDVVFMLNPNRICFKNDNGTLCLNRVKLIKYNDDLKGIGKVFSIVCGNRYNKDEDTSYTIIADKEIS